MGTSKSGSMKGWRFKEWLKRNKESLKMLITGTIGLGVFFATKYLPIEASAGISGVSAIVSKLGLDALDFYLSDVKIDEPK